MGDMADYYREQEEAYGTWPDDNLEDDSPRITRASRWTTRDGQKIAVRDMTVEHLRNILKMHAGGRVRMPDAWLVALQRELARR
jgi:hypothetical protein